MGRNRSEQLDMDMLAEDIANMLDRYQYPLDASADDIRAALPAFITAVQTNIAAAAEADQGNDAATWCADTPEEPTPQRSRRPRMTYLPWARSQLVMLGATARDEHYWQCPHAGCKVWAGPYPNPIEAKQAGFEHVYRAHR